MRKHTVFMAEEIPLRFKTKRARELSTKLLHKVKKHLTLQASTKRLESFLPIADKEKILSRQAWTKQAIAEIKEIQDIEHLQGLLKQASEFTKENTKRHNNIVIAFGDEDEYDTFKSILGRKFYVTLLQTENDLLSISHYEEIRYIPGERDILANSVEELQQATIHSNSPLLEDIAPEIYTDSIEENKEALQAMKELRPHIHLENLDIPLLSQKQLRFETIQGDIENASKILQDVVQKQISSAQFSGDQLVSIIQHDQQIIDKLPKESRNSIIQTKRELITTLEKKYQLVCSQCITIDHIGKVLVDEKELDSIRTRFISQQQQMLSEHKQSIALQAKEFLEKVDIILEKIIDVDLKIAISLFTNEFQLYFPKMQGNGQSFVFGKNMNLLNAVPVEYYIGNDEKIAVITGANSGGKTTLLELLAQIQILAQMGLPVPARQAQVGIVEELYYFSKNKGSASAGAFETLLNQFSKISDKNTAKLILADEIESVTEPDIAAKIIKGIISHARQCPNNILILVTHMGKELSSLKVQARFDGIEAKGLDKDLNLVVDRNPIIGKIARSTPQLIIERLAKKEESLFYTNLFKLVSSP